MFGWWRTHVSVQFVVVVCTSRDANMEGEGLGRVTEVDKSFLSSQAESSWSRDATFSEIVFFQIGLPWQAISGQLAGVDNCCHSTPLLEAIVPL